MPGGGQQHKEEDLPVRLSGRCSAEGGQGKRLSPVSTLVCISKVGLFMQANSRRFAAVILCNRVVQSKMGGRLVAVVSRQEDCPQIHLLDTSATKWDEQRIETSQVSLEVH